MQLKRVVVVLIFLFSAINAVHADDVPNEIIISNIPPVSTTEDSNKYPLDILNIVKKGESFLTSYRPMYVGYTISSNRKTSDQEIKFQISFKYNIVDKFYLGYTQKSIWGITAKSAPIKATDYTPELFYIHKNDNIPSEKSKWLPYEYMLIGLRHESNGLSGVESIGWNMAYIEPYFSVTNDKSLIVLPTLWYPFTNSRNKVLIDDIGIGKLTVKWQPSELLQLSSSFRHGLKNKTYAVDAKVDHMIGHSKFWFNPSIFVGVWNGYGEMLESHAIKTTKVIIGFSAAR